MPSQSNAARKRPVPQPSEAELLRAQLQLLSPRELVQVEQELAQTERLLDELASETLRQQRIDEHGSNPFMRWCLTHFQHAMVEQGTGRFVTPADFHHSLTAEIHELLTGGQPRPRHAGVLARELAKTTYGTTFTVIYAAVEVGKKHILVICATKEHAKDRIRTIVEEIETNETLRAAYPELRPAIDLKGQTKAYTDYQIILANGCIIRAVEFGARMRGANWKHFRPDLAVFDDPESDELRYSPLLREKRLRWIDSVLLRALVRSGAVLWLGTLVGDTSILAQLRCPLEDGGKGWSGMSVPLAERETQPDGSVVYTPSWPERHSAADVAQIVAELSPEAAEEECFNNPQSLGSRPGDPAWFDDNQYDPRKLSGSATAGWEYDGRPLSRVQAWIDSAPSIESTADYSFIAVWARLRDSEQVLILDAVHGRFEIPEQLRLLARLTQRWGVKRIPRPPHTFETVLSQLAHGSTVDDGSGRRVHLPFEKFALSNSAGAKDRRIRESAAYLSTGMVLFAESIGEQRRFRQEFKDYPGGKDDAWDTLACICRVEFSPDEETSRKGRGGSASTAGRSEAQEATGRW